VSLDLVMGTTKRTLLGKSCEFTGLRLKEKKLARQGEGRDTDQPQKREKFPPLGTSGYATRATTSIREHLKKLGAKLCGRGRTREKKTVPLGVDSPISG